MATAESVKSKIQTLIATANSTTGKSDTDLTTAVNSLVSGYGQGGGGVDIPMVKITFEVPGDYPVNINYMTVRDNALVGEMVSGKSGEIDVVANSHINIWTETPSNPFDWTLTVDNIESSSGEYSYAMYTCWGDQSDVYTQASGDDHMIITTFMG